MWGRGPAQRKNILLKKKKKIFWRKQLHREKKDQEKGMKGGHKVGLICMWEGRVAANDDNS
jgi:hypothetical protein